MILYKGVIMLGKLKYCFVFTVFLSTCSFASNQLRIDIESLDYKLPEKNSGVSGTLAFPRVRLNWDDMKLFLKNQHSFLEAQIELQPRFIKFETSGLSMSFPLDEESLFFSVYEANLTDSRFNLNSEYFNFSGSKFIVGDGVSRLSLDKFNIYCSALGAVDMTSIAGLTQGCLTELILNGQTQQDLAGAKIEFHGTDAKEKDIFFEGRFKSLTMIDSLFELDLSEALIDVENYEVKVGDVKGECAKEKELIELDLERLQNGCLNQAHLQAPFIKVKNKKEKSFYEVKLDELSTVSGVTSAKLEKVNLITHEKVTTLKDITINCLHQKDVPFYNLHQMLAGCVERAEATIPQIVMMDGNGALQRQEESWVDIISDWFQQEDEIAHKRKFTASGLKVNIDNNKMDLFVTLKVPYIPRFNLELEAYINHIPEEETIRLDIIRGKAMKIVTLRKALLWAADFFISDGENIKVNNKEIIIKI
jgi:hypothetical protein